MVGTTLYDGVQRLRSTHRHSVQCRCSVTRVEALVTTVETGSVLAQTLLRLREGIFLHGLGLELHHATFAVEDATVPLSVKLSNDENSPISQGVGHVGSKDHTGRTVLESVPLCDLLNKDKASTPGLDPTELLCRRPLNGLSKSLRSSSRVTTKEVLALSFTPVVLKTSSHPVNLELDPCNAALDVQLLFVLDVLGT